MENGTKHKINAFIKFSTIQPAVPQLEGIKLLDFPAVYSKTKQFMLSNAYKFKFSLRYKRMHDMDKHYIYGFNIESVCNGSANVYMYQDRIPGIKKDYLRATCKESDNNFFVKAAKPMELGIPAKFDMNTYYHALSLKSYPKNQWRQVIKEYQHVISLISANFIDLDELVVPQDFIDSKKKIKLSAIGTGIPGVRRQKLKGEINGKEADELQKWSDGRCCKFVPKIYKLEKLESDKNLKVYAHHDDYMKLDALFGCIYKQDMKVVTFSQRELAIVKDSEIHNLMSLEQFMEGKNKPFKRMATAYLIKKMIDKYRATFERHSQIGYTSSALEKRLVTLSKYVSDNYYQPGYSGGATAAIEFLESMLAVAEENKLFDMTIYPEVIEMQEIFGKLPFLNPFMAGVGYYDDKNPIVNVLADLFKYYRYRVNINHYNIKLNEEVISEETIEELVNN
jgi:hypothetical protein